jgi:hypothetical protein
MIGLTDALFTQLGITGITALALICTLYISPLHTHKKFSVFISRILATDLYQSHCNFNSHVNSSCRSLISLLHFISITLGCHLQNSTQFSTTTNCSPWNFSLYSLGADPTENTVYCPLLFYMYLLIHYLAIDVLLLRASAPAIMCLPSGCLAIGLYVTIFLVLP